MPICMIYDCETSGLVRNSVIPLKDRPHLIEFFGHLVDDQTGDVIRELEFFANPGFTIDPVITRITGITPEQLVNEKPFSHYATDVLEMINEAEALVAHNLAFDLSILEGDLLRCGIDPKWPSRLICTVQESEWLHGHRLSLSALHEELFGEPFSGAHRARTDVEALTKVYLELVKRGDI